MFKITEKIRALFGRGEDKPKETTKPTEKPFFVSTYLNGKQITGFSSSTQNLKTLSHLLKMFSLYGDYTIEYGLSARKIKIYFAAKKSDLDKQPQKEKKEDKKK